MFVGRGLLLKGKNINRWKYNSKIIDLQGLIDWVVLERQTERQTDRQTLLCLSVVVGRY